jgi:hypothetical protein
MNMSSRQAPYPHDRARARTDIGEQPYKDARETMNEKDATLQAEAERFGEENLRESEEERNERLGDEAAERLREVQDEIIAGDE